MNKKLKANKSIPRVKKVISPAKQRENITAGKSLVSATLRKKKNKPALTKVLKKITKTNKSAKGNSKLIKAKKKLVSATLSKKKNKPALTKGLKKITKTNKPVKGKSKLIKVKKKLVSKNNSIENEIIAGYKNESDFLEKSVNTDSSTKVNPQSESKKNIQKSISFSDEQELPSHYGTTYLKLLVRDPFWIYAYWEISETAWKNLNEKFSSNEISGAQTILRLYEVSLVDFNGKNANHYFDIGVGAYINNWHINLWTDNVSYVGEIGIRVQSGEFFALSRSNCVNTPRIGYSSRTEQMWMKFIDEKEHSRYIMARIKTDKKNNELGHKSSNKKYTKTIYLTEEDIRNYYKEWHPSLKDVLLKKDLAKNYKPYLLFLKGASDEEREKILSKLSKGYYSKNRIKGSSEERAFIGDSESTTVVFPGASESFSVNFIGASEAFIQD